MENLKQILTQPFDEVSFIENLTNFTESGTIYTLDFASFLGIANLVEKINPFSLVVFLAFAHKVSILTMKDAYETLFVHATQWAFFRKEADIQARGQLLGFVSQWKIHNSDDYFFFEKIEIKLKFNLFNKITVPPFLHIFSKTTQKFYDPETDPFELQKTQFYDPETDYFLC